MKTFSLTQLQPIVSLCKRRGFIFPASEIYGGFANTYSFGPYGTLLKNAIKNLWWKTFVQQRADMVPMDGPILLHPSCWKASGHVDGFNDAFIDCKECKGRFRVDHLLEEVLETSVEGKSLKELTQLTQEHLICPKCGKKNFTDARHFNLMFSTKMNKTSQEEGKETTFLRPETAQAIFLDFKHVYQCMRKKLPFGIGQIGKAFRNEITPKNFVFRTIEFEQMEIEYFTSPKDWSSHFAKWQELMLNWCQLIGLKKEHIHIKEHAQEQLSHYSKKTIDITYDFPFGRSELYGLAYRGDFDLAQHQLHSKQNLQYIDPITGEKFLPHVIEPTFGLDRTILALLCDAYDEEVLTNGETRTVLHLAPNIAPVQVAIFPLMKKDGLLEKAHHLYETLQQHFSCEYDTSGAIGKRYRRQDELGTPYCLTVDYESLEDESITLRDRDSMEQKRIPIKDLVSTLEKKISSFL